jgi:phosphatidylglycerophosphate synthase
MKDKPHIRIVKSTYYSNWGDRIGYPLASIFVKPLSKIPFITPNGVTLTAFTSFALGCVFLTLPIPYFNILAGIMIFSGYVGDDIDGQLARVTGKFSTLGDYLDKVLDVLKIFLITFFSGLAVYLQTNNIVYLLLGFIACFFFLYRYYIKLETMFSAISRDEKYLDKSSQVRKEKEHEMDLLYSKKAKNPTEALHFFWTKNRTLLIVDEAEFAILVATGSIFNRLDLIVWILAIAQVTWGIWRAFERGTQLETNSKKLLLPMRK